MIEIHRRSSMRNEFLFLRMFLPYKQARWRRRQKRSTVTIFPEQPEQMFSRGVATPFESRVVGFIKDNECQIEIWYRSHSGREHVSLKLSSAEIEKIRSFALARCRICQSRVAWDWIEEVPYCSQCFEEFRRLKLPKIPGMNICLECEGEIEYDRYRDEHVCLSCGLVQEVDYEFRRRTILRDLWKAIAEKKYKRKKAKIL